MCGITAVARKLKEEIDKNVCTVKIIREFALKEDVRHSELSQRFKLLYKKRPVEYLRERRLARLRRLLFEQGDDRRFCQLHYAEKVGLRSAEGLNKLVKDLTGKTYGEFRAEVLALRENAKKG